MRLKFTLLLSLVLSLSIQSQVVYEHVDNREIYAFLSELENDHIISINTTIKPYPKKLIAEKLLEAMGKRDELSIRQRKELDFYYKAYKLELPNELAERQSKFDIFPNSKQYATALNPVAMFYKDEFFTFIGKPVAGVTIINNDNGTFQETEAGASIQLNMGSNLAMYARLSDRAADFERMNPKFLHRVKSGEAGDWNTDTQVLPEIIGGITYDFGWGNIGMLNDHFEWGPNYAGSNIISGSTNPAFPAITFNLKPSKWFEFNYFHGWLASGILDQSRMYYDEDSTLREVFRSKFLAANMLTFKPWKHTNFSLGNSVIYGDMDAHPGFLIPFFFYRPVDYQVNSLSNAGGTNGQMYGTITTRVIKKTHLYASLFIDELGLSTLLDPEQRRATVSWKGGLEVTNVIPNTRFVAEYTRNRPWVYRHYLDGTDFATNEYNIGHYLGDNAHELFSSIEYRPIKGLLVRASYEWAQKGPDLKALQQKGENDQSSKNNPFMEPNSIWDKEKINFRVQYQFAVNATIFANYQSLSIKGDQTLLPSIYKGETNTISTGFSLGF